MGPIGPSGSNWRSAGSNKEINHRGTKSAEIDAPRGTAKDAKVTKKESPGKQGINTKIAKTGPGEQNSEVIR